MKKTVITASLALGMAVVPALAANYTLKSPDGRIAADISSDNGISYSVTFDNAQIISPSALSMEVKGGKTVGAAPVKAKVAGRSSVKGKIASPFYRADSIAENYNQLTIKVDKDWNLTFRAYNDGVAYRWAYTGKKPIEVAAEGVEYNFPIDAPTTVPYVNKSNPQSFKEQFMNSFENTYTHLPVSKLESRRLMFLPLAVRPVEGNPNVAVTIVESDLNNYPGLFLNHAEGTSLKGVFAPKPSKEHRGGHIQTQMIVDETHDYIASVDGARTFPWRIAVVTDDDKDIAATNLTYLLATPSKVADTSWIKPGKVAWDWWNDWNLDGVPFKTGVNNDTYKAYIDFASKHGIEYVILDEGWARSGKCDLFDVIPEINLPELVEYGKSRNVGLILWAGYMAFAKEMERVCSEYAKMGIKGFKVDFLDRNDQIITDFEQKAAEMCAKYNMLLDIHGTHIPAGINRTWPNVVNVEGVFGLEQMKWSPNTVDMMDNDCTIPFLRQVGGPLDYTQGAMRNATRSNYHPCNNEPMSQGTRAHQLALYMIFDSPLNMLCDTPSAYDREPACTEFIAQVPTTWDETRVLTGRMGDYIATARRKGDTWYIGAITDWTPRDLTADLSFLTPGVTYDADAFIDGPNAHRIGRDFARLSGTVTSTSRPTVHLAPGGGAAVKLTPRK